MGVMFDLIAFDADDTLWHTEVHYAEVQRRFRALLDGYGVGDRADDHLLQVERRNLAHYGYGVKGFTLSLVETAIELTGGRIIGAEVGAILEWAKTMLMADVELLDHARDAVARLAETRRLMLITKGDLHHQELKIAQSGLRDYFQHVEIVSDKTRDTYATLLARHRAEPAHFLMIGNSLRSDILPVLELGGWGVYIPYQITWVHEVTAPPEAGNGRFHELQHIGLLPNLVQHLEHGS